MKPSTELIDLVEKRRSQAISSSENTRLEELLKDEGNLDYYLDMAGLDAGLTELSKEVFPMNVVPFVQKYAATLIAAAAVVMFMFGFLSGKIGGGEAPDNTLVQNSEPVASDGKFALITSLVGVEWDGAPTHLLLQEGSDSIKFKSGLVEVTFGSGVRALVEGPAEIQITGENQAYLERGRLVADVPKGAEGFTVDYQQGKLIDLGTEFAMDIQDDAPVEVGVFRGEVEVYTSPTSSPVKIIENHAILHGETVIDGVKSVPFERAKYVRKLPSSEFSWKFPNVHPSEQVTQEFDVSHLVWKSGEYRAVVKWMNGRDGVSIHRADLYCDGKPVASDAHRGATGIRKFTHDNVYSFHLSEADIKKGDWKLKFKMQLIGPEGDLPVGFSADSVGLVLFEDVGKIRAKDRDFIGKWEYLHDGRIHQREFHADHTATYYLDGEKYPDFDGATWQIENNVLILKLPASSDGREKEVIERHLMRNKKELIFESLPYRNGKRVK